MGYDVYYGTLLLNDQMMDAFSAPTGAWTFAAVSIDFTTHNIRLDFYRDSNQHSKSIPITGLEFTDLPSQKSELSFKSQKFSGAIKQLAVYKQELFDIFDYINAVTCQDQNPPATGNQF